MPLDLDKVRANLNKFKRGSKSSLRDQRLLKIPEGKTTLRIVPYKFNPDYPFIEMYFHYDIGNRTYLSPISNGNADPFVELAEELFATRDKDDRDLALKLNPTMRVMVPVIVRGKEDEGVKFWQFSKTIYQELLSYIDDEDWGDFTHPKTGRDITVEKGKPEGGRTYGNISIKLKPKSTPVIDPDAENAEELLELLEDQVSATELYTEYSYEEMKSVLEKWLNPSESDDEDDSKMADEKPSGKRQFNDLPFDNEEEDSTSDIKDKIDSIFKKK